jgi:hypothetical protein
MLHRSARLSLGGLAAVAALASAPASDAATTGDDRVARGLDIFLHAPSEGAPRALLPVQVIAYGFPTVTSMVPLPETTVEAVWDPEHLGPGVSAAPPPVRAVTDSAGRVHLDVPIPPGDQRELVLLVGVQSGEHQRARTLKVNRVRPYQMTMHVPEQDVVPGGSTSVWVRVTSATTGEPAPGTPVDVTLDEGGYTRSRFRVTTDNAGTATTRVPIPHIDESTWSLSLGAVVPGGASEHASMPLSLRDETPGSPLMTASFRADAVKAGDRVKYAVRVRDATGQPVIGLPVRAWVGPKGTDAPSEAKAWEKASTLTITNAAGEIEGEAQAPSTLAPGASTSLKLIAKTKVDGHELEEKTVVEVGYPSSTAALLPEAGAVVPGIEQRMLVRVLDGHQKPVSASFSLEGDGLKMTVTTDAHGEAEVTWSPPLDLGAFRNVGPCAGGVAAAVIVRPIGDIPALGIRREPFELCVPVDRDIGAIVRPSATIARSGERVTVRIASAKDQPKTPWSLVLRSSTGTQAASLWAIDGEKGAEITLPEEASGVWTVSAAGPSATHTSRLATGAILVTPRVLPKLSGRVAGGRAAPGGTIEVEAEMTDGRGGALPGTVAAVLVDLHGGGSVDALSSLDTRMSLCQRAGLRVAGWGRGSGVDQARPASRCDALLEEGPALDPLRRALLPGQRHEALTPETDPGGTAKSELIKAFGEVLRSLEGAVFEATSSPERLRDVRRKGANGWTFNPELMTLVTSAMEPPPTTPGGEPLALADLFAVDPQVTFDTVAKRVTRLKIFRVLVEMRAFRHERQLDAEEPALKDPNAILRRLVRDGRIAQDLLLDPWGGTIQFMKSAGPPLPFLTVSRGFELRAPGPDRQLGSADDIRDPFERVVKSGTPYAQAVSEDRIVDAKVDMEVGDATISAWQMMFEELTGTALGSGGLGLSGVGEGGGGRGEGIGLGSIGTIGYGRGTGGAPTGASFWSRPIRTDANGKARIRVPLGAVETTWRVALIGVPDRARPAVTTVDVPVALPLSARVDVGSSWVEGDEVSALITVRNRTAKAARASVEAAAGGAAALSDPKRRAAAIDVPAGGAATARVWVKAARTGRATLNVTVRSPGLPDDTVSHTWEVSPKGEPIVLASARWVEASEELKPPVDPGAHRVNGAPRLVLERGDEAALNAALHALEPDRLGSLDTLADALESASRIGRWATTRLGERSPLALRALEITRRASGKLASQIERAKAERQAPPPLLWAAQQRGFVWSQGSRASAFEEPADCLPNGVSGLDGMLAGLAAEPPPVGGAVRACWDASVAEAARVVIRSDDPVALARAVLALAERPHRAAMAANLADRLRERVSLTPNGEIALPVGIAEERSARAIVLAALIRASRLGKPSAASEARIAAWLRVQRDAQGGYGSTAATRSVVQALIAASPGASTKSTAVIVAGALRKTVELSPSAAVVIPLDPGVTSARVEVQGAAVLARFEQPALRLWSRPPERLASPLQLETVWPAKARAGDTGRLLVNLRHGLGRGAIIDTRIPLPPGVSLAARISGVRQLQGVLAIRTSVHRSPLPTLLEIPLRFSLSGRVTAPEARARLAFEEVSPAVAPARPFTIE